jgi:hypothetical protein
MKLGFTIGQPPFGSLVMGCPPPEELDCAFCSGRLEYQLRSFKLHPLDDYPLAMFTSTGHCGVRVRVVDPEDMSERAYTFCIPLTLRPSYVGDTTQHALSVTYITLMWESLAYIDP